MSDYQFWASRYKQQASWTRQTRNFIIQQLSLPKKADILEIGCGSYAVLNEFVKKDHNVFGIDIDHQILAFSKSRYPEIKVSTADGYTLPFTQDKFDLCYCHYFLLWMNDPVSILIEMMRVTKKTGWICCFAEPDYSSRIDAPPPLEKLGLIQNSSLEKQGVNLSTGRNIPFWLIEVNLKNIHWGIIGAHQPPIKSDHDNFEWEIINKDLSEIISENYLDQYKQIDQEAKNLGSRILFIPTFYAYAQK
jgi:SAM-dependent methyltransferase